jgi:hypothetical protein
MATLVLVMFWARLPPAAHMREITNLAIQEPGTFFEFLMVRSKIETGVISGPPSAWADGYTAVALVIGGNAYSDLRMLPCEIEKRSGRFRKINTRHRIIVGVRSQRLNKVIQTGWSAAFAVFHRVGSTG